MKTREERAKEYAEAHNSDDNTNYRVKSELGFLAGAESEHACLMRWNDPKEVLPEEGTEVLVKYRDLRVFMACYDNSEFGWNCYELRNLRWYRLQDNIVIGWREIHE